MSTDTRQKPVGVWSLSICAVTKSGRLSHFDFFFCFSTDTWESLSPMLSPRKNFATTFLDGCLYAVGGTDGRNVLKTAERYNLSVDAWEEIRPLETERRGLALVAL